MQRGVLKLIEECAGEGDLSVRGGPARRVRYQLSRYQAMLEGTGMPIPGLHRIEGAVASDSADDLSGEGVLRMNDGRSVPVSVDCNGRLLNAGHGPQRCSCC